MSAQLVRVTTWAAQIFGDACPHANTLYGWIRNGRIKPAPIKVGRAYFCKPDARYYDPVAERRDPVPS